MDKRMYKNMQLMFVVMCVSWASDIKRRPRPTLSNSSIRHTPWSARTKAPPSRLHSLVRGSLCTPAVNPTAEAPLPVVYTDLQVYVMNVKYLQANHMYACMYVYDSTLERFFQHISVVGILRSQDPLVTKHLYPHAHGEFLRYLRWWFHPKKYEKSHFIN